MKKKFAKISDIPDEYLSATSQQYKANFELLEKERRGIISINRSRNMTFPRPPMLPVPVLPQRPIFLYAEDRDGNYIGRIPPNNFDEREYPGYHFVIEDN